MKPLKKLYRHFTNDNFLHVPTPSRISLQKEFSYLFVTSSGPLEHHRLYYQLLGRPPTARLPARFTGPRFRTWTDSVQSIIWPAYQVAVDVHHGSKHQYTTHYKLPAGHSLSFSLFPALGSSGSFGFYSVYPRKRELIPCN